MPASQLRIVHCLAFCLLLLGWSVQHQTIYAQDPSSSGNITGTVLQEGINDPLAGANVYVEGTSQGVATAPDGTFQIVNLDPGTYTLIASVVGYEKSRQNITVEAGETATVTFRLLERPIEISELVVERVMLTGGASGLDDIPGSAHYIDPRELEEFSYTDAHRVLRKVPGLYIQEEDGYGLRPNIGLRGTGVERSSKITVMEDGVLAAPAPYAAPSAYYFPTVGRMQGVEVRKGSSQIKYGPYTTGGAINFISTQIPTDLSGRLNALAGSDEERLIHAYVGDSFENVGFLVETFQARVNGFKELTGFENADAGFDYNTGFDKQDYLAKVRFNTDADARVYQALTLKASQTEETSNETYLGLTEGDFESDPFIRYAGSQEDVMRTEHQQYQVRHFIRPASFLDVTTTAYYNGFKRNWFKLDDVRDGFVDDPAKDDAGNDILEDAGVGIGSILSNPEQYTDELAIVRGEASEDGRLEVKNNNREYYSQGIQTVVGLEFGSDARLQHEIEIGGRIHEDQIDRFQWVNDYRMAEGGVMQLVTEREPGTESNRVTTAQAYAGYIQYRLTYDKLTVVPGLRYENITIERENYPTDTPEGRARDVGPESTESNDVNIFIPGIGIDYDVTDDLTVFTGIHKGFAPPGSDPQTDPEESINYEIGSRYRSLGVTAQGVFFYNDYSNLLGRDLQALGGDASGRLFNGGEARVYGLELSAGYDLGLTAGTSYSIPLEFSYTLTQATFQNSFESDYDPWGTVAEGDELPYLPEHQVAAQIGVDGLSGFAVRLSGRYVSQIRTVAGQGDFEDDQSIDGHFVLDAAADYTINRYAKVFASMQNVTDEVYAVARRPAGLRPGLPRTLRLGVKVSF